MRRQQRGTVRRRKKERYSRLVDGQLAKLASVINAFAESLSSGRAANMLNVAQRPAREASAPGVRAVRI